MNKIRRSIIKTMGLFSTLPLVGNLTWAQSHKYTGKKLGIALVGLGGYATLVAQGLEESDYWKVTGIVTGSPDKIPAWKNKWSLPDNRIFNYENYDDLADADDIDVVYICLPNSMHAEFTVRAAKAGKHVICEKPMAVSVEEAEQMLRACDEAGVKLAIGYRLHFNAHHQQVMAWGKDKTYGDIRHVDANFSINVGRANQWRLRKELAGGGSLMDVGIYCVQAARYATNEEPLSVTAQLGPVSDPQKFREVEDSIAWQLKFPSGAIADCRCAYNTYIDRLTVAAAQKTYRIEPAYAYGPLAGEIVGESNGNMTFPHVHHQRAQMEGMGPLFLSDDPLPDHISGLEGLKDMKTLMSIYEAAKTGKEVRLT